HTRSKRDWSSDVCSSDLSLCLFLDSFFCSSCSLIFLSMVAIVLRLARPSAFESDLSLINVCFGSGICFISSFVISLPRNRLILATLIMVFLTFNFHHPFLGVNHYYITSTSNRFTS